MQLIDTHVHINFDVFQDDLENVSSRWRDAEVFRLIHSCVEPDEFASIQALSERFPELYFAVGLHPLDADRWHSDFKRQIAALAQSDPKVVAIGEMGLDFYKADNPSQQQAALMGQLEVATELDLPVIIHCRDAATELLETLTDFWQHRKPLSGVMHCWGGTPEETEKFLDLGFYISFSGIVTFKNAKQVQASAQLVPRDRILIETDCPFLAPIPKRGKRNEPSYVRYVAEYLAQLRNTDLEAFAQQTTRNACHLFSLPLPDASVT